MQSLLRAIKNALRIIGIALLLTPAGHLFAQAALFLEQPYGIFGTLNPTGHAAVYLQRVCADTPVHLRMCNAGETGVVISRYKGLNGYDWIAIPLIPYLYAVEDPSQVLAVTDRETVDRLRYRYKESRLGQWDNDLPKGNFVNGGWTQLVGTAYDRNTYAFRFATTAAQDEQLIAHLNGRPNHSHFNLLFNNCADFDRAIMNYYFPHKFRRTVLPDAGITTPKRVAYDLVKHAKRHPEVQLTVLEIPQVPGFRHKSRAIHGVAESIVTNGYVIPIFVIHPYIAGGLLADYLVRGRYSPVPKHPTIVGADNLEALTATEADSTTSVASAQAFASLLGQSSEALPGFVAVAIESVELTEPPAYTENSFDPPRATTASPIQESPARSTFIQSSSPR
jgi:hypothetical protein